MAVIILGTPQSTYPCEARSALQINSMPCKKKTKTNESVAGDTEFSDSVPGELAYVSSLARRCRCWCTTLVIDTRDCCQGVHASCVTVACRAFRALFPSYAHCHHFGLPSPCGGSQCLITANKSRYHERGGVPVVHVCSPGRQNLKYDRFSFVCRNLVQACAVLTENQADFFFFCLAHCARRRPLSLLVHTPWYLCRL